MTPRIRLCLCLLFFSLPLSAQNPAPRLTGPISDANHVVLPHSRSPRVQTAQDLGPLAPDTAIPGITLTFRRSSAQEAALHQLLTEQQTRGSRLYHQWLTPDSFAARFGVADSDLAATENWLSSQGFHIDSIARSRDRITFSGTARQVQTAFGAALHHYRVDGEAHFAPAADLSLPANLAPIVGSVLHLSDFRPKPGWKVPSGPSGDYTAYPSGAHYLTPADIAIMYQVPPPMENPAVLTLGDGQMAVAGQSYVNTGTPSPVSNFGGSAVPVLVPNSGVEAVSYGDEGESEIDIEYSSKIAGQVYFVFTGNSSNYSVFDAVAYAITEDIAPVVSISYGSCEPLMSSTDLDANNAVYEEAVAQGQTLVASAGDSGSTACSPYTTAEGVTTLEQEQLAVNFPASSPYFTAVGGTAMASGTFAVGNTTYWSAENAALNPDASLLSYVPEVAWNDGSPSLGILAGGGGISSYFPRPAWQTGVPGIPTGAFRLLPDIALQASVYSPGYVICTDDPSIYRAEGQTASCTNGLQGNNDAVTVAGGTSFAAPIFAAYIATLNHAQNSSGQGNVNPILYGLAANAGTYASVFHDITSGSIGCVAGATDCTPAAETAYPAGTGYDLATGLGSINIGALESAWPANSANGLETPYVLALANAVAATPGQTLPISITVGMYAGIPTQTTPTGNVSVSVDGVVVNPTLALTPQPGLYQNGATATYNLVAPSAPGGHVVVVKYLGDATHTTAISSVTVMVGTVQASGGMTLSAGNVTVSNGSSEPTTVTITPTGGYNGTVFWSLSVTGTTTTSVEGCYSIAPAIVSGITTTQLTIGTGAACTASANVKKSFRIATSRTPAENVPGKTALAAVYASLLFAGSFAWRRRKAGWWMVLLLLAAAGANLTGCGGGGGSSTPASTTTTPPATAITLTATLTGTDSVNASIVASTNFTLTINGL
jgi:hypothetical protein